MRSRLPTGQTYVDEPSVDDEDDDDGRERLPPLAADVEASLLEALSRPLREDEGHAEGHRAKELEVRAAMMTMTPMQALVVQRRFELGDGTDSLAVQFARMIPERRARLIDLLVEIRRRNSIR